MVSFRNFFAIAAIMLVVLLMFQFTNVALEVWNDFGTNENAVELSALEGQSDAYVAEGLGGETPFGTVRAGVAFVGASDSAVGQMAAQWAAYAKRNFESVRRMRDVDAAQPPELIVLDAAGIAWSSAACDTVREFADAGASIVFATLPDASEIEQNRSLRQLLGIYEVRARSTTVEAIHLYGGFLLGGERLYRAESEEEARLYQDLALEMPWYVLGSGTKVYMKGVPAGDEWAKKLEEHPAVIWRHSVGAGYVFAVNGDYMQGATGLGLLSAMATEAAGYSVYPVVNAQNLVMANYPGFASENGAALSRYYSMSMRGLYRDVLWPDVTALYRQGWLGLSCLMVPQFDYDDANRPDQSQFAYYMRLMTELQAEAGLSVYSVSDTPASRRMEELTAFLEQTQTSYRFSALYESGLAGEDLAGVLGWPALAYVRTVAAQCDGGSAVVGYQTPAVTRQTAVTDGFDHTFSADLRMRCVETALGYTNVLADFSRLMYPAGEGDAWNVLSQRLATDVLSSWEDFRAFDATTLSESDARVRSFLTLDYDAALAEDEITLQHSGSGTAWFVVRVPERAVTGVEGGSFRQVEDGVYLVEAEERRVTVHVGAR